MRREKEGRKNKRNKRKKEEGENKNYWFNKYAYYYIISYKIILLWNHIINYRENIKSIYTMSYIDRGI